VAVVGAGPAGLATAAVLAAAGRRVVLLERAAEAGGVCRPIRRDGLCFEIVPAVVASAAPGDPVRTLCRRLRVEPPLCRPACRAQLALPGHRLTLHAEPEGWLEELRREAPGEESGWQALTRDLDSLRETRGQAAVELPGLPPEGWGDRVRLWRILTFGDPALRAAVDEPFPAAIARHAVGPLGQRILEALLWHALLRRPDECSTLEAAVGLAPFTGRAPEGVRVASLLDALLRRLREDGGCLRLQTEVAQLLVERGRVNGVTTVDGETIRARQVVAALSPPGLGALLPRQGGWRRRPAANGDWRATHRAQALLVGLPDAYVSSELADHCLVATAAGRAATEGRLASLRLVRPPAGGDACAVSVTRCVPASEEVSDAVLAAALEEVIPGGHDVARHREWLGPAEIAAQWGRPGGGVRFSPEGEAWLGRRGMPLRPGWRGLWAVGEWVFPGRQVSSVLEGALRLADRLLEEL
jgi:phytoene dehydrogenase-like protein